jgi:hypothetical protein
MRSTGSSGLVVVAHLADLDVFVAAKGAPTGSKVSENPDDAGVLSQNVDCGVEVESPRFPNRDSVARA